MKRTLCAIEITPEYREHRGYMRAIDEAIKRLCENYLEGTDDPQNANATFRLTLVAEKPDG